MAASILSASGVLNITGALIGVNAGNGRPLECLISPSLLCARNNMCEALKSNKKDALTRIQNRLRIVHIPIKSHGVAR